jgi:hypothetical protein
MHGEDSMIMKKQIRRLVRKLCTPIVVIIKTTTPLLTTICQLIFLQPQKTNVPSWKNISL